MRKHQKNEIQTIITLLYEAHDEIKKSLANKNFDQAMMLLGQCQEAAIKIGALIEETEGEDFITIGLLEHYCEKLYEIHEGLSQKQDASAGKIHKVLRRQLIPIENSVKNDISVQIEAVFLPYKASMWDSLESVWQAAEEDENCSAYVIPIPYYDRNPDGSFREMHYEGDQFPEYVPITHYEEYDLEAHRPDMIYIHNPYDGQNLATSVHPVFYSDKLKQYTDCLVYIPYFVLGEISPDNQAAIDNMKHFCTVSGVFHADKVIVQSEDMRQVYVNVLTEYAGVNTRRYWENKILGIGSPKFDKLQAVDQNNQEIPKEWLEIIQRADGSRKKVILYNTAIGSLLKHEEKMLEKMQDVFQVFKENKDEVALLWRPHPLVQATIGSIQPTLWKSYSGLVKEYKDSGWGIYDDTPDLNRAIVLSDAYYGDWSSIVWLYKETGKSIMIQNIEI